MLFRRAAQLMVLGVALYSIVHFGHTVTHTRCIGDFIGVFPGLFVARYNPQLCQNVWSIYGFGLWGRVDPTVLVTDERSYYLMSTWGYGPIFHFITLPLTLLPNLQRVCVAWTVANLIFLGITAVLIYRMVAPPKAKGIFTMAYLALWANFYPLLEVLRQGNIELFELMVVVLACFWFKRDAIRAGFLLGMAAMTKFLPLIFLPYCAVKKSWKVLAASLVTVAIIACLTEPLLGWNHNSTPPETLSGAHIDTVWIQHQTLSSIIWRWFADFPDGFLRTQSALLHKERAALAFGLYQLGCGVSLVVGLWILLKTRATILADFSLLVSAMIFLPPWNHMYYQVFLLLPFSFLLGKLWQAPSLPKWTLLAVCYLATCSLIVPLSVVDSLLKWGTGTSVTLMQNLALPAWANLLVLLWLIKERCEPVREEPRGEW